MPNRHRFLGRFRLQLAWHPFFCSEFRNKTSCARILNSRSVGPGFTCSILEGGVTGYSSAEPHPRPWATTSSSIIVSSSSSSFSSTIYSMSLLSCPNELLLLIAENLVPHAQDLKNLLSTNRRLHFLLQGRLYRLAVSNTSGEPVLHWATKRQHTELLLLLLDHGADPNIRESLTGLSKTALHCAAECGATQLIQPLLDRGARIDLQDASGRSALARAITLRHFATACALLDSGADASAADHGGATALHCVVCATRKTSSDTEALVGRLVASGAVVDCVDCGGATPLYLAVARGYGRVVRLLVEHGADLFLNTERGNDAVRRAVVNGDVEMARLLLEQPGADVNHRDGDGRTALHLAASMTVRGAAWDLEPIIRLLLSKGGDVSIADNQGARAAVFARHAPQRVRALLEGSLLSSDIIW